MTEYEKLIKRLWICIQLGQESCLDLVREKHRLERQAENESQNGAKMIGFLSCSAIRELSGVTESCCMSCHYDDEDGYVDLADFDLPDGQLAFVCCALFGAARGMGGQ